LISYFPWFLSKPCAGEAIVASRKLYDSSGDAGGKQFNFTTVSMLAEFSNQRMQNELHMAYTYYAPRSQTQADSDYHNTTYDVRLYDENCVSHGNNARVQTDIVSISVSDPLYQRNYYDVKSINSDTMRGDGSAVPQVFLDGASTTESTNGPSTLVVPMDIHQEQVFESPYFQYVEDSHYEVAHISFCTRLVMFYDIDSDGMFKIDASDPYKEMEAVQFHETLVELTFNLSMDFQVSGVNLQKDAIVKREDNQRLKYNLQAFHCQPEANGNSVNLNTSYVPAPNRLISQSTILYICFVLDDSNAANIGIREVDRLELIQPASQINSYAIYSRTPNAITTETHYGDKMRKRLVVSTRLVLPFFDNKDPTMNDADKSDPAKDYDGKSSSKVICKGTVIMMFQDDDADRRRLLGFNRDLQEAGQEQEESFEVEVDLVSSGTGNCALVFLTFGFAAILAFGMS